MEAALLEQRDGARRAPREMRAAVYRAKGEVRLEAVAVPQVGDGEILVRVDCCGVCGTDIKKIEHGLAEPPRIFGHEIAGTVALAGAGVTRFRPGDRVALHHHIPCRTCFYCRKKLFSQCEFYRKTGTTAGYEPAGGGFAEYVRVMDWIVREGTVAIRGGELPRAAKHLSQGAGDRAARSG
jgi:L-iditol 2-dehydrogenase